MLTSISNNAEMIMIIASAIGAFIGSLALAWKGFHRPMEGSSGLQPVPHMAVVTPELRQSLQNVEEQMREHQRDLHELQSVMHRIEMQNLEIKTALSMHMHTVLN